MSTHPTHPGTHPIDNDITLSTLSNGVRVIAIRVPYVATASVAVFVRTGSAHESRALNGISHFVEHMLFKGTRTRDVRRINLDAESLGAEVNAHTDKDHTAYYMHGMAGDAATLLRMLGDIVLEPSFPADELERERQVLLHECTEDEEDPMSTAFKLFDKACFGLHPVAQSVIGPRHNIERLTRDDLVAYVQRQYSAGNLVIGAAGLIDPEAFVRDAEAVFGALPASAPNRVAPPAYRGGVATRRLAGNSQAHAVLGFAIPALAEEEPAFTVAAAVFGEGMSSPLMDQIREQRGLAYYAACSADVFELSGQFVVEASTAPGQLDELLVSVMRLLREHAASVNAVDLQRAQQQLAVRRLRAHERPYRRLEDAALDLLARGSLHSRTEWLAGMQAVSAADVAAAFGRMLETGASLALAGALPRAAGERARQILGGAPG